MRTILDTSVLLGPASAPLSGEFGVSTASLAELHLGVLVGRSDDARAERLRRLGVIERTFEALPVDAATARRYGRFAAAVAAAGRSPRPSAADLLIAATAAASGARLATRKAADPLGLEDAVEILDLS